MIRSLLYLFLHRVLGLARPNDHIAAEAELEIAVLRHQVAILRRQVKRPIYRASDKAFLAASSRLLRREAWSAFLVRPETRHCCVGYRRGHQGDSRDEITPAPSCPTSAPVSLLRVPVPARGHHPGGPLVPAVRPVLPGRRGAPRRARGRGRPRQRLPVGPAVRTGVRGGGSSSTAHHSEIAGTWTRPLSRWMGPGATCSGPSTSSARSSTCTSHLDGTPVQPAGSSIERSGGPESLPWRSPPTGTGSTPGCSMSCCRRPSTRRRSMRTTRWRLTMDGSKHDFDRCAD